MTPTPEHRPFGSTVITSIARPSVERAVLSVLEQGMADGESEIVVVNDSGGPLPPGEWQASPAVRIIETDRIERCAARNAGAAAARGEYIHLLDDDDWIYPGGLRSLCDLARRSRSSWVYGAAQLVDREGHPLMLYRPALQGNCFTQMMAGEWIPIGTFMVTKEAFFEAGGFQDSCIGMEDIDFYRRASLRNDIAGCGDVVACIGMGGQSNLVIQSHTLPRLRREREAVLDHPLAHPRFIASADSAFWRARVARIYLTSFAWNAAHGRRMVAARRMARALSLVGHCPADLSRPTFWREMLHPSGSVTFRESALDAATRSVRDRGRGAVS